MTQSRIGLYAGEHTNFEIHGFGQMSCNENGWSFSGKVTKTKYFERLTVLVGQRKDVDRRQN